MRCEACEHENVEGAHFCARCGAVLPGESSEEDRLIGQLIGGRFRITRVLGEGGMGVVYEAEQKMGSAVRKVALKTLHSHLSHDPSVAARFHRECGTVAQLEHPNTIKVYDFGATPDGTLYIAMEFVRGKPLNELIAEGGALPPDRVLRILRQISGSLAEAHRQGIVHRDLKPENVVLTERAGEKDVVKLLDFGIAARTESADAAKEQKLTQQGMVLGTPPYMSPEQFTGKALDARSDIYSLGIMAYEMLTGRLPFDATTPWQWATEHMTSQPIPFEATPNAAGVSETMRRAILRALEKDREKRQPTVDTFYKELAGEIAVAPGGSAHESTGTAAMEAAPDFASAPALAAAKTAHMPAGGYGTPQGVVAVPPVPPPPASRGGGKGLVIGLASLGGVLLIGIVVVAAQGMKKEPEPEPLANAFGSGSETANIAPVVSPEETAEAVPEETAAPEETEEPPPPKATGKTTSPPKTADEPKTSPPPKQTAAPPPKQEPPKSSGASCSACVSQASSGNISGAVASYNSCTGSDKAKCAATIRNKAPEAAKNAALNGNCGQAKAIVSAAGAIGAGSPRLTNTVSKYCP